MSRIFISHSSANNAAALALASWLDANGWSDYFLDIDDNRGIVLGLDGATFQIPLAPGPQRLREILSREGLARLFAAARHLKSRTFLMLD